jgi:hypothetical protein
VIGYVLETSARHGTTHVPNRKLSLVSLSEAAIAVESNKPGPKCGVHVLRANLPADDRKLLDEWLPLDSGKTSTWISEVLVIDKHQISEFTIQRHRRGKCSCAR